MIDRCMHDRTETDIDHRAAEVPDLVDGPPLNLLFKRCVGICDHGLGAGNFCFIRLKLAEVFLSHRLDLLKSKVRLAAKTGWNLQNGPDAQAIPDLSQG